jgi:hypothetical protein
LPPLLVANADALPVAPLVADAVAVADPPLAPLPSVELPALSETTPEL